MMDGKRKGRMSAGEIRMTKCRGKGRSGSTRIPRQWVTAGFLFLAVVFIIVGITNGEMEEILQKAIHICLECIGVG